MPPNRRRAVAAAAAAAAVGGVAVAALLFTEVGLVAFLIGLVITFALAAATGGKDGAGYSFAFVLLGWPLLLLAAAYLAEATGTPWGNFLVGQ